MKKILYNKYGNVDNLFIANEAKPEPSTNQLLIKVKAVSINPFDWKVLRGDMKLMSGSNFPKPIGSDFSGVVESIGSNIKNYKVGDEVFGVINPLKEGTLAEYIVVTENQIAIKPKEISFEKAAAMASVGQTALQLTNNIKKGDEVLINGASGGVGMFALQFAKSKGAIVTSVASKDKLSYLEKWGSDFVIDYNSQSITDIKKQYDYIIELSEKLPYSKAKSLMKNKSIYITAIVAPSVFITSIFNNILSGKKHKYLITKTSITGLQDVSNEVLKGIEIHINKTFSLEDFKNAFKNTIENGGLGKVVFTL